jgi:integrase
MQFTQRFFAPGFPKLGERFSVMASLLQRGNGKYYVRVYVHGKPKDIATGTTNIKLAEKFKQKIEYENSTGKLAATTQTSIDHLLRAFLAHLAASHRPKSVQNDTSRLRVIFGPVIPELEKVARSQPKADASTGETQGKRPAPGPTLEAVPPRITVQFAEEITAPMVNQFLDKRARAVGPKTLNAEREILYRLFSYATEHHGLVCPDPRLRNPMDGVKARKTLAHEIRFLTLPQITQQLDALQRQDAVMHMAVAILIYAGLRREEALWLTPDDIDRVSKLIRVRAKTINGEYWQPKTARNRAVPIATALGTLLDKYLPTVNSTWLLPSPEGVRWDPDNFSHKLADLNAKSKLPWTCLDFRHTFGSMLAQRGVSLYKTSAMMGNSPEICRKHYAALIHDEFHGDVNFAA